jgi:uncharacterized sporulation protein YeaH/YhbH (DUF444 family)
MLQYLHTLAPLNDSAPVMAKLEAALQRSGKKVVRKEAVSRLEAAEQSEADRLGLDEYKMKTNEEMLAAMGM